MIFLIKKQKVPSLILLSKLINFYEAEALKPNEKSGQDKITLGSKSA